VVSTLGEVAEAAIGIEAPSIVVVGEVVRFRAALDWLGALATAGVGPTPG
jgi:uroporphyrin-III C-methyltransferase